MSVRVPVSSASSLCALVCACVCACEGPADASVLLDLKEFSSNGLPDLRDPRATLDVVDDDGAHVDVEVETGAGERTKVTSPLPVPCGADGRCGVTLRMAPTRATFTLHVSAADRCGARAELVSLTSAPVELSPWQALSVALTEARFDFDDDADDVVNVLEHATCGRFDNADGALPPQACADETDPCCADTSPLEGRMTAFAGGAHVDVEGKSISVEPFALDATEVTWRQLKRCVAAGACLVDRPDHPARAALEGAVDDEPVVGLVPADAEALCAFFGKRLPLDSEWDFAAAHRDGDPTRARYPFDSASDDVGCTNDFPGVAANFSAPGSACPGVPVRVGSYPTSHVSRGAGVGVADLGGNVAEWTLVAGSTAPEIPEVPAGHDAVVLRGGGARSPLALLENDLVVRAALPASGDVDAWRADIVRLAAAAGVRCALSVDDGTLSPPVIEEPACAAAP